ncbi:MAG: nucleoside-diphosphate-sugar epimerase [Pseudohongiellaceae bacterium]|jgi:nucleoside-diphosphate-sugar epimerase
MTIKKQIIKEPILVTGAAGFIGRRLVKRLLDEGRQVRAFDVMVCPESLQGEPNLHWFKGDVSKREDVKHVVAGCHSIFHLAALVGDWGQAVLHQKITVEGTQILFDLALASPLKPRLVLASSIVVYGDQLNGERCYEGMPHGWFYGPYGKSKQTQETIAHQFIQQGLDIRMVRPANVYGAGSKPWVDDVCVELKKGLPVLIAGGNYNAGLVHVDNVIEILILACKSDNARGQIFNAADEEGVTWQQYMKDLAECCGASKPKSMPRMIAKYLAKSIELTYRWMKIENRPPLTAEALNLIGSNHRIDMTKTKELLDYKPVKYYREGLEEIRQYLKI